MKSKERAGLESDYGPNMPAAKSAAKSKLGVKRQCQTCGAKFYDLGKRPAVCPKCGHSFDPEEAVRIFQDVGADHAVGHHWGTFRLTDEAIDEPPKRLAIALERANIAPERFRALRPGEVFATG